MFHASLKLSEQKHYSQNGEDGVLVKLAATIGRLHRGYYVEFGASNGAECNTRYLREKHAWRGLLMDGYRGHAPNPRLNLHIEQITHDNIVRLLAKHEVPRELDVLSVDTDFADYWILESILISGKYAPKIVVHEANGKRACVSVAKPARGEIRHWDGASEYSGASVCAYQCLAQRFGYTMVYCESKGVNCFWLRDDMIGTKAGMDVALVKSVLTEQFLYPFGLTEHSNQYKWTELSC